jgi:hypothetical protein
VKGIGLLPSHALAREWMLSTMLRIGIRFGA